MLDKRRPFSQKKRLCARRCGRQDNHFLGKRNASAAKWGGGEKKKDPAFPQGNVPPWLAEKKKANRSTPATRSGAFNTKRKRKKKNTARPLVQERGRRGSRALHRKNLEWGQWIYLVPREKKKRGACPIKAKKPRIARWKLWILFGGILRGEEEPRKKGNGFRYKKT